MLCSFSGFLKNIYCVICKASCSDRNACYFIDFDNVLALFKALHGMTFKAKGALCYHSRSLT